MIEQFLPELIAVGGFGLLGWFCRNVLAKLDSIKDELHEIASAHGERIARLEVSNHSKQCGGFDFRRRQAD